MSFLKSKHSGWLSDGTRTPFTGGGGGGQSGPTQTTVQNTNIPEYARPYVETMLGSAQQQVYNYDPSGTVTGFKPYVPYGATVGPGGQITNTAQEQASAAVAPFSPLQQQAQFNVGQMRVPGQFDTGTGFAALSGIGAANIANQAAGAGQQYNMMATNPFAQQAFMSPYIQNALQPQLQEMQRQYDITGAQERGRATGAGAFGGSRQALMQAENQRNKNIAMNQAIGMGFQDAFKSAQQAQQFGANLGLQGYGTALQGTGQLGQAGRTLADIGGQQLQAQQGIVGLQSQFGQQQQALEQQKVNQAIQNYAMQQQYPMQQLAAMSGLLRGLPLQSATTQSYQAPPSAISQIGGLGLTGAAAYGMMKKEGGVIKSYKEGGDVSASAAPPASSIAMNVPTPEGYKFDAATGQYHDLNQGNSFLDFLRGDSGLLAKLRGRNMAEGGAVEGFADGGITRDVMLNPEKYSAQMIDRSTKNGIINDIVGLAALQQKNQEIKERQGQMAMAQGTPPTVKDQVLAEAQQLQGIDNAPSNLPTEYAGGGIVAFQTGGSTMGGFDINSDTYEERIRPKIDEYVIDPMTGEKLFSGRGRPKAAPTEASAKPDTGIKILPDEPKAAPSMMTAPAAAPAKDTGMGEGGIDDLIRQSIGDIRSSKEASKDARKEAKLMAMLQAGLGIMSGTSPYAAANVKGAIPALKGYQEEMRGIRSDENKQIAQIAALGLKGAELKNELNKLGITKERYDAQNKLDEARAKYFLGGGGRGAGLGGAVPPNVSRQVMQEYKGYAANPTQAPFFSSLPKDVQTGLSKYKPGTQSYNRSMEVFRQYANREMMNELNFYGSLNRRSPAATASLLED
jgi:hypothetical protein